MAQLDPDGPHAATGERGEVANEPRGGEVRELPAGRAGGSAGENSSHASPASSRSPPTTPSVRSAR